MIPPAFTEVWQLMLQRVFQDFKENTNHSQQPVITNNECLKYIIHQQKINPNEKRNYKAITVVTTDSLNECSGTNDSSAYKVQMHAWHTIQHNLLHVCRSTVQAIPNGTNLPLRQTSIK